MSILEYSVAKKIYNNLTGISPAPDEIQIISKKVDVEYTDLSGTNFVIDIGNIPEGCVLINSHLDISIPFIDASENTCTMSAGIGTMEESYIDYPIPNDYRKLIFDQLALSSVGVFAIQGEKSGNSDDKTLNAQLNSIALLFNMPGIWSAGGALSGIKAQMDGTGTTTTGIIAGGRDVGGSYLTTTEEYNGFTFSTGGSLNTGRGVLRLAGAEYAGLSYGGDTGGTSAVTEEYNGTAWTGSNALNTGVDMHAGCGTQDAALSFQGDPIAAVEEYNGSSWTAQNSMISGLYNLNGAGTQSAAVAFGGYNGSLYFTTTEEYNGLNWSMSNDMNSVRRRGSDAGIQTSALMAGGYDGVTVYYSCETYDGTTWSFGNDMSRERRRAAGFGSSNDAVVAGGIEQAGGYATTSTSEEYHAVSLTDLTQGSLTFYVTYTHV